MSLDNLDKNFKKVAKSFSDKDSQKQDNIQPTSSSERQNSKYEDEFVKKPVTGLLAVFENHLRNSINKTESDGSDEEFRTVSINQTDIVSTENQIEKVSEEEIESLINISKPPSSKKQSSVSEISVNNDVYSQKRYDETHDIQNKVASANDVFIKPENEITSASKPAVTKRYTDNNPVIENYPNIGDKETGLQPVNVTKKKNNADDNVVEQNIVDKIEPTNVSSETLDYINQHRENKRKKLPPGYIADDKN